MMKLRLVHEQDLCQEEVPYQIYKRLILLLKEAGVVDLTVEPIIEYLVRNAHSGLTETDIDTSETFSITQ